MFDHDTKTAAIPRVEMTSGVGELDDVSYALDLLAKVDWAAMHGEQAVEALADITALRDRVEGITAKLAGAVDRSSVLGVLGYRGAASFLRSECRVPKVEASRRALLAKRLAASWELEPVLASFEAGRIGFAQASLIAQISTNNDVRWAFGDAVESFFIPTAEQNDYEFFKRACQRWVETADVTQGDGRDRRQDAKQKVRVSPSFDGMVRLDGWLPTVAGETFANEFERLRRHLYDLDVTEARERLGRAPGPDELSRTADERSVAVLVLMAQRSASLGDGPLTALPCVNIMMDYDTFVATNREFMGLPALYPANGVCRTEAGVPVSPRDALESMLAGFVRRVVFDPAGHILDFGQKARYFVGGLREAVMLRDQTCVEPGCNVPARFCEIDHCRSWTDLGHTSERNGNCRCRFHNGRKGRRSVDPIIVALDDEKHQAGFERRSNHTFPYRVGEKPPPPFVGPGPRAQTSVSRK